MDNEVYASALKSTLNEIRNACPDITNAFLFREGGEIIAGDDSTSEKAMTQVVDSFDGIFEKASAIGGVERMIFEGSKSILNVFHTHEVYLVTITSGNADMKYVNAITHVMVPTVLKLLDKICSTPMKRNPSSETNPKIPMINKDEEPVEEPDREVIMEEPEEPVRLEVKPETLLLEPPTNQLIVENLGGLLVPSDTVRIDSEILTQWESMYDGRKIEEVEIATFDGKATKCKVKPIKDSKYEGKGIIQMPEKVQVALEIKKGELVKAKPIVD
jgi:hypothetical protein